MKPSELFEANLATIERVIAIVCRRARWFGEDSEDFASEVKLALVENDYAILASYEGRSSLDTYLTVVIQRLLADARTRAKGRWHASAEAQRLGPAAALLETLVRRDGRSLDEALPHMRAAHPDVTRGELQTMLDRLPERAGRLRPVDLDTAGHAVVARESADARAIAGEKERISNVVGRAMRSLLETFPAEDRLLIRPPSLVQLSIVVVEGLSLADGNDGLTRVPFFPTRPRTRLKKIVERRRAQHR